MNVMDTITKERLIRLAEEDIPIHKYFGLKVEVIEKGFIKVKVPFRKDLVGDIRTNHWHGGIIALILGAIGGAIGITNFKSPEDKLSTIDLRVDYLTFADGNDLIFEGKLVRMGNRIMVTKMKAIQDETVVAEGKGVYNFIRA